MLTYQSWFHIFHFFVIFHYIFVKKFNLLPKPGTEVHLSSTGYQVHKDDKIRQRALKKASKKYDTLEVLRRLNLIRNLTPKHTNTYKKMSSDVDFMKKYYKHSK